MDAEQRMHSILALARTRGRVSVQGLAEAFEVAPETIRRDLRALDDRGLLRRVHGGAIPIESVHFESDLAYRSTANVGQKLRIAAASAQQLHGAETVFIDEGFTPRLIAEQFTERKRLTVVTASLPVAMHLAEYPQITVLLIGGRLRPRTLGTVDHWAVKMLHDLAIDLAYIGANGITVEHGLTTPDPAVMAVKQAAIQRSRRRILIGAHTKFGVRTFCRFAELKDFELTITGTELPAGVATAIAAGGTRVLRV